MPQHRVAWRPPLQKRNNASIQPLPQVKKFVMSYAFPLVMLKTKLDQGVERYLKTQAETKVAVYLPPSMLMILQQCTQHKLLL